MGGHTDHCISLLSTYGAAGNLKDTPVSVGKLLRSTKRQPKELKQLLEVAAIWDKEVEFHQVHNQTPQGFYNFLRTSVYFKQGYSSGRCFTFFNYSNRIRTTPNTVL